MPKKEKSPITSHGCIRMRRLPGTHPAWRPAEAEDVTACYRNTSNNSAAPRATSASAGVAT
jgi:hypothetical protein